MDLKGRKCQYTCKLLMPVVADGMALLFLSRLCNICFSFFGLVLHVVELSVDLQHDFGGH